MKRLITLFFCGILVLLTQGCTPTRGAGAASVGVSTDGRYAITAHGSKELYLWDIVNRKKKLIAKNAYGYSASFIPDSHEFMWQDMNNIVHIQHVNGQEIKQFAHFKVENHKMSSDKSFYLSADTTGEIYKGYGNNLTPIYTDNPISSSHPYSLSMVGNYILSANHTVTGSHRPPTTTKLTVNPVNSNEHRRSSYNGVTLWNKTTLKPMARLWGNTGTTAGAISPDGKWVVAGSTNLQHYMWPIQNLNNRIRLANLKRVYDEKTDTFSSSGVLPIPQKFKNKIITNIHEISAIAFVSDKDFIAFQPEPNNELAVVYTVGDPWIKAYVETGRGISIGKLSIASAPKANILVTGKYGKSGINVYKYHPATKELEKIWSPN